MIKNSKIIFILKISNIVKTVFVFEYILVRDFVCFQVAWDCQKVFNFVLIFMGLQTVSCGICFKNLLIFTSTDSNAVPNHVSLDF